jgi:hypothetical protein
MPIHDAALLLHEPAVCILVGLTLILIFLWRVYERGGVLDLLMAARGLADLIRAWAGREVGSVG